MSKALTIKSIVKGTADKPTFGTNPRDPWSAKANIAEDAALNTYLKSRGINPEFATKDQKVSHSKTGQFIKWKRDHMIESITEAIDKMDVVMFDIPLLIRMLEYAREDAKTDMDLHKVVEKLIHIRKKGVLTMKDYTFVTRLRESLELDENHVAIAMGQMMDDEGSMVLNQLDQMDRAVKMVRDYIGADYEKQLPAWVQSKLTLATDYIDTVGNYLSSKNEDVNEAASASIRMYKALQQAKEKREREERLGNELLNKKPPEQKPVQKEEVKDEYARKVDKYLKKKYAPEQKPVQKEEIESFKPMDQPNYNNSIQARQKKADDATKDKNKKLIQMSKSARIIKSIYKRKNMKEETFDTEKEDKSVATYGKKPKLTDTTKKIDTVGDKTQAAAIMSGGTTLTGTPRDVIEIDPMMKLKPGLMGQSGQSIKPKNNNR